ncbi:MAG: ankyrin repeat domain-containing protein [Vulcanimicrobiota bacterium]
MKSIFLTLFVLVLVAPGWTNERVASTPLQRAAIAGDVEAAQAVLADSNLEARNNEGRTALLLAATTGNLKMLQLLVEAGADRDAVDHHGLSALHLAASNRHTPACRYLLEQGANPNLPEKAGNTPLHLAARAGNEETVKELLLGGAKPALENERKQTAMQLAQHYRLGDWRLVERLLEDAK